MKKIDNTKPTLAINLSYNFKTKAIKALEKYSITALIIILSIISIVSFIYYHQNGLGLAYNDARSHLDIGRRVVENLKPGLAQLGSVWLPLPHLLMIPTIWNDFMWHSGLSGAIISMFSYVLTGVIIYLFLKELYVSHLGRFVAVLVFALNINILYLQSTAMTELLLLATMMSAVYELVSWHRKEKLLNLIKAAFWVMLSTLIRYDGWFLLMASTGLVGLHTFRKHGFKTTQGVLILFVTLASFGVSLWFIWNLLIFGDPLYFALGEYSARAQQTQLEHAGILLTKGNILFSLKTYWYALLYNAYSLPVILTILGFGLFLFDKKISTSVKFGSLALFAPYAFNVAALFLGHSVLFVQGLSGSSWFNVRYGIMLMPTLAIFTGYLVSRLQSIRYVFVGLVLFVTIFSFLNYDAVTLDDARFGSSGKNVAEVSGWLKRNAMDEKGFVLISAASHDAIIFSSHLPMSRFIHEGTGLYWDSAISRPDRWARWIIMRTNDENDSTFKSIKSTRFEDKYLLIETFPFADIYELKPEYLDTLQTEPVFNDQK